MNQKIIVLVTCLTIGSPLFVQAQGNTKSGKPKSEVYTYVEEMPVFQGNVNQYLMDNLRYPTEAKKQNLEGKVMIRFVVDYMGRVDNVTVTKGVHPLLDEEAIRAIKAMPRWKPAKKNGSPVDVYFTLPVWFKLDTETEKKG